MTNNKPKTNAVNMTLIKLQERVKANHNQINKLWDILVDLQAEINNLRLELYQQQH